MRTQSYLKQILQVISGLVILLGLFSPSLGLAQTVTPPLPPPLAERRQLTQLNPVSGTGPALQPNAALAASFPASRLAFQSYRDSNWEIYAGNDDGSNLARLTNNGAADMQPRINRGATRIAFTSRRDGDYEIFSVAMDGSGLTQLTKNTKDDVSPSWSPEGTKIAFQSYRDGQPEIYVMNADGTGQTRLTNSAGYDGQPAWSPDGSKIAYISGASYNLYVMNADGSNSRALALDAYSTDPTWSPDGIQIAYDADFDQDGFQELMMYDTSRAAASMIQNPLVSSCDNWAGSWSPDGRYLAYTYICYVYYRGAWYWTDAYLETWDSLNPGSYSISLAPGNVEWNPDWQSTDPVTPTSYMQPLPTISASMIGLQWGGADVGGSGLKSFDVQYKDGANGSWKVFYTDMAGTSQVFYGASGHTYYFRVRARSNALNVEPWPADYDAMTTVDSVPPIVTISPLPEFSKNSMLVRWRGFDPGGFGISGYRLQYKDTTQTTWIENYLSPTETARSFYGATGYKYCVRMNATDISNNVSPFTEITEDDCTTIYSWQLSGVVHDNAGAPVESAQVTLNPLPINTPASNAAGEYVAYGDRYLSFYNTDWSRSGYGSLPLTTLSSFNDVTLDVTLPPTDDVMQNGGFETGSLAPENWQTSGTLPVTAAGSAFHTGQFGAQLGDFREGSWDVQEKINEFTDGYSGGIGARPRLVIDAEETSHAVWVEGSDLASARVEYASKAAGGAWTTPETLSDAGLNGTADIAIDGAGTVYVAWPANGIVYRSKPKGGGWSDAAVAMTGTFARVRIGADQSGIVHVIGDTASSYKPGISYSTLSGGIWSAPYIIDSLGWNANMVIDSKGDVHVAWVQGYADEIVLYASRSKDGVWSPTTQASLGLSSYASDLYVDDAGAVYVVWIAYNKVNYRVKLPGSDWGPVEAAVDNDSSANSPSVRVCNGRIVVSYTGWYNYQYGLYSTERGSDGTWLTPVQIAPSGSNEPYLTFGPDGRFSLIWYTTGQSQEVLYREEKGEASSGDAVLSQSVTIPESLSSPTLAFHYQLQVGSPEDGAGLKAALHTAAGEVSLLSAQTTTNGWVFQTFDLSQWSGQTVTLEFRLHKAAWGKATWARIDDATLGSAYADAWVSAAGASGRPGDTVTINITCGNHGGAAAAGAALAVTLPAGLNFVSADPAPLDPAAPALTWNLGDMAPKSSACSISLTATIDPSVTIPHDLAGSVTITSVSPELETGNNLAPFVAKVPYYFTYLPSLYK